MSAPVQLPSRDERAGHFAVASLLMAYPAPNFHSLLRQRLEHARPPSKLPLMDDILDPSRLENLQSAFIDTFDRAKFNPLYETAYGQGTTVGKGNTLADIAGFYRAFGLDFDPAPHALDMVDHVAVELEFYSVLLLKEAHLEETGDDEGVVIVQDARQKFLGDHLGRLMGALAAAELAPSIYGEVVQWAAALVQTEAVALGVEIWPLRAVYPSLEDRDEMMGDESMTCGAVNLPVLPA